MPSELANLTLLEKLFAVFALVGGVGLFIRLVLQFVGGIEDSGVDLHAEVGAGDVGDGDASAGEAHMDGATPSFHLLTLQGLTGFLLMFGLVGLALSRQSKVGAALSLLGGLIAGILALVGVAKMFSCMLKLQSSGNINLASAVGEEGSVYLTIPANGTGKVQVVVQEHLKVLDAVSSDQQEIKTGERIEIVKVVGGSVLAVKKL